MIRIVNWLLTRRCNLNCEYCAIVKDYHNKPEEYPDMKHYHKNEMSATMVINALAKFMKHNPDCFHIFYGGEPLLMKGLSEIINYCHRHEIHYTIISNNTEELIPVRDKLLNAVGGKLKGFTASIDPIFTDKHHPDTDRYRKSIQGLHSLRGMKEYCDDLVAEITVMRDDVEHLYNAVKKLSGYGISSDITFVDIAKSDYYDFSNVTEERELVDISPELAYELMDILAEDELNVHMKSFLIPAIYKILPSNMDCEIEKDLHNVSIDADGSVRLCLRIRGVMTPMTTRVSDLIDSDGNINRVAHHLIAMDKAALCKQCNHTCHLMSKYLNDKNLDPHELVHLDRR